MQSHAEQPNQNIFLKDHVVSAITTSEPGNERPKSFLSFLSICRQSLLLVFRQTH